MRIAITGQGVVAPIGLSVTQFCEALLRGEVGIREAPWSARGGPRQLSGAMHDDFDPSDWMEERIVRGTDGFARFAIAACVQAVDDAGLGAFDPLRTGVVHGTSMGGAHALERAQRDLRVLGPAGVDPKMQIKIYPNMAASQLCMRYGLHGPSVTVTTACASSLDALGTAAMYLDSGAVDVALCGATDGGYVRGDEEPADFTPAGGAAARAYGMQTPSVDPLRAMLPFDAERSGIVGGEGSAFFVLETAEHAERRGAKVHAWLCGYGSLADAYHPSSPEPEGRWEERAMRLAQDSAGVGPGDVDALVAHATGTPKGDEAEIRAINRVFADESPSPELVVTALKGHTGHTGAASGAMNVIAGIWAMHDGQLCGVAGTRKLDPEIRFDVALGKPRAIDLGLLQVNSFGFGGQNASVVLRRHP